jgi:hypothetical protein
MTEKLIAEFLDNGRGFSGPILKLTISEEFIKQPYVNFKELEYDPHIFIIGDSLNLKVGPYIIKLRFDDFYERHEVKPIQAPKIPWKHENGRWVRIK